MKRVFFCFLFFVGFLSLMQTFSEEIVLAEECYVHEIISLLPVNFERVYQRWADEAQTYLVIESPWEDYEANFKNRMYELYLNFSTVDEVKQFFTRYSPIGIEAYIGYHGYGPKQYIKDYAYWYSSDATSNKKTFQHLLVSSMYSIRRCVAKIKAFQPEYEKLREEMLYLLNKYMPGAP
jgi:hypothetical protein